MIFSFSQYLPLKDLLKILVVCLVVAVIAPTAVSVAIVGLDRRATAVESHRSTAMGDALILVGVAVIVALIATGIYTLFEH
jgi:hypothetical protein